MDLPPSTSLSSPIPSVDTTTDLLLPILSPQSFSSSLQPTHLGDLSLPSSSSGSSSLDVYPSSTPSVPESSNMVSSDLPNDMFNSGPGSIQSADWLNQICLQVVNDMNCYGICVIDNFLGEAQCSSILNEVKSLYGYGIFQEGQLVRKVNRTRTPSQVIRSDKIVWVDGGEPQCVNIGFLIQTLDAILFKCNTMENNGIFSRYQINNRTKAMIACYPGNGTRYVKHVDNPNGDGRRITSIYYLNQGWDLQRDGGLLRMYPTCYENHVADIAPLFDRVLFFWSDRRNPHEVQPAFSTRFAITVWYFDDEERNQANQRYPSFPIEAS
ncbi:egl nine homolog 1 [Tetranychus urticae]|uniref:hypoxia-inducible factor-proline dioxygenase n=1 Tax=Tetranychus urticae TaxID=32264 RepID=T1KVU4_TETUR|nr:egl nine homolog 1 [Tetranychus urticae]